MGGFANVLGEAAGGYAEAAQKETQRQFASEMDRRQQIVGLLGKLAADESAHPEVRNRAFNMALEALHSPHTKQYKPDFNQLIVEQGQGGQQGAEQASQSGPPRSSASAPAQQAAASPAPQLQAPPAPPSNLYFTPEEQTGQAASRAGALTNAQQGAQLHTMIPSYTPEGQVNMQGISGTGKPIGEPIKNAVVPQMITAQNRALIPVHVIGPDGVSPIPAIQNKITKEIFDQNGELIPNATLFAPSLITKATSSTTTDPLGMQTTTQRTTGPAKKPAGGGKVRPQLNALPTPPGGGTASTPPSATPPTLKPPKPSDVHEPSSVIRSLFSNMTPGARDVVASEMDRMMLTGVKPGEKFNKVQQAAYTALSKEGLTPPMSASEATRTRAEAGKAIIKLIADARALVARDPSALGPMSGRWSQLAQKVGNLEGPAKELAGTLKSIYSLAGSLHGWRAIRVADEFEKTYGGIQNTPASLESGFRAMEQTAHAVMGNVPGMEPGGGGSGSSPSTGVIFARDEQGKLHQAPAGTALPKGWKQEQR